MSEPAKAVFLSYAREDTAAAQRIAEALRSHGVEVWFDQNELRGGDSWDAKIRKQIDDCTLFVALISQHTEARAKGYFRLEWKLAVEQTHMLLEGVPFVVPVAIDETPESSHAVPPEFQRVQWTRLPGALPTPQFVEQIKRLLATAPAAGVTPVPFSMRPAGATPPTPAPAPGSRFPSTIVAALAVVVFALIGYIALRPAPKEYASVAEPKPAASSSIAPSPAPAAATATSDKSIAVLPFENLSTDPANAFFAGGVHEDLLTALQKVRSFRVISRTSVLGYHDHPENLRQIARDLGVNYVVEGSVRRAENRVLVTAQLIDARSDQHLWADNFEAELNDVFAIQGRIAAQIAAQLSTRLSPEERDSLATAATTSIEAYKLFQQGRDLVDGTATWAGKATAPGAPSEAIALLQAALALDPNFRRAWGELVEAYCSGHTPTEQDTRLAEQALGRLHAIAPDDPWTHFAEANLDYLARHDWNAAMSELAKATTALPNEAEFVRLESRILRRQGDIVRAITRSGDALQLDPRSVPLWRERWENMFFTRQYAEGAAIAAKMINLEPSQPLWRFRQVQDGFLATGDPARFEPLALLSGASMSRLYGYRGFAAFELAEVRNDRAGLRRLVQSSGPATEATDRWLLLLALHGLGETDLARAVADDLLRRATAESGGRDLVNGEVTTGNYWDVLYNVAAGATRGEAPPAARLTARFRTFIDRQKDARTAMNQDATLITALQVVDCDEAAAEFLARLDKPMNWLGLDFIAAFHWEYRPLLTHPRVKPLIVKQGKWLHYLADRVPEYAEFKPKP